MYLKVQRKIKPGKNVWEIKTDLFFFNVWNLTVYVNEKIFSSYSTLKVYCFVKPKSEIIS